MQGPTASEVGIVPESSTEPIKKFIRRNSNRFIIPGTGRGVNVIGIAGFGVIGVGAAITSMAATGYHPDVSAVSMADIGNKGITDAVKKTDDNGADKIKAGAHPQAYQEDVTTVVQLGNFGSKPNPPATRIESSSPNVLISEVKGITAEKIGVDKLAAKLMPEVPTGLKKNAEISIPMILNALHDEGIDTTKVIAFALANSEPESNLKVDEEEIDGEGQSSRFNYDGGKDYAAKGLSSLTHKYNYEKYGKRLRIDLVNHPELALDKRYSAKILAAFLKDEGIADAVEKGDLKKAREIFGGKIEPEDTYRNQILSYVITRTNAYYNRLKQ